MANDYDAPSWLGMEGYQEETLAWFAEQETRQFETGYESDKTVKAYDSDSKMTDFDADDSYGYSLSDPSVSLYKTNKHANISTGSVKAEDMGAHQSTRVFKSLETVEEDLQSTSSLKSMVAEEDGVQNATALSTISAQSILFKHVKENAESAATCLARYVEETTRSRQPFEPRVIELAWEITEIMRRKLDSKKVDFMCEEVPKLSNRSGLAISFMKLYAHEAFRYGAKFDKKVLYYLQVILRHSGSRIALKKVKMKHQQPGRRVQTCREKKHSVGCPDYPRLTDTEEAEEILDVETAAEQREYIKIQESWKEFFDTTINPLEQCIEAKINLYLRELKADENVDATIVEMANKLYRLYKGKEVSERACDEEKPRPVKQIVEDTLVNNMVEYYCEVWNNCDQDAMEVKVSDEILLSVKKVLERAGGGVIAQSRQ